MKFCFQTLGNRIEKIKTGVDKLLLVSKMKKRSILGKYIGIFVLLSKPKVVKYYVFWTRSCKNWTKFFT